MFNQLKAVLNRCVFSATLKLVRDEADHMLLGREFQTCGAHDEKWRKPLLQYVMVVVIIDFGSNPSDDNTLLIKCHWMNSCMILVWLYCTWVYVSCTYILCVFGQCMDTIVLKMPRPAWSWYYGSLKKMSRKSFVVRMSHNIYSLLVTTKLIISSKSMSLCCMADVSLFGLNLKYK